MLVLLIATGAFLISFGVISRGRSPMIKKRKQPKKTIGSSIANLARKIKIGESPDDWDIESAITEALESGEIDLARSISETYPSTLEQESQPEHPSDDLLSPGSSVPPSKVETPPQVSSPLRGIDDVSWSEFVKAMKTDSPSLKTDKHIGAFRYRKERLSELGIKGDTYQEQYDAFARDMEILRNKSESLIGEHMSSQVEIEGKPQSISESGILALLKAAGPKGAKLWLEKPETRSKFPGTTALFVRANGIF